MGIVMVYDITNEPSFKNIDHWIRNVDSHASENVDKILIGNKCDMEDDRAVATQRGQALADDYSMPFMEVSAKTNVNVVDVFTCIARIVKKRLMDGHRPSSSGPTAMLIAPPATKS